MTRASETRPTRRVVIRQYGPETADYVVEIRARTCTIRPARTRRGGPAEVEVSWGAIYHRGMVAKAEEQLRARRARRKGRTR